MKSISASFVFASLFFLNIICHADRVAVLPFKDQTDFKGVWTLSLDFPRYLSAFLSEKADVVPHDTVVRILDLSKKPGVSYDDEAKLLRVAPRVRARYLISGRLTRFYVIKKMAGNAHWGGYKHYNAGIELKAKIYDSQTRKWVAIFPVKVHDKDRGLPVNLPLKLSKDEKNFHQLEKEPFGSEVFRSTVAGAVLDEACSQVLDQFQKMPLRVDSTEVSRKARKVFEGAVLAIDDEAVYVNLGFDDSVYIGERFPVYTNGAPIVDPSQGDTLGFADERVGEIEVTFVKARHLCAVRIVSGKEKIRTRDRVRVTRY